HQQQERFSNEDRTGQEALSSGLVASRQRVAQAARCFFGTRDCDGQEQSKSKGQRSNKRSNDGRVLLAFAYLTVQTKTGAAAPVLLLVL
ncbi:MAG TPA: hypothetical protein VFE67_09540, partial [Rudaea sp.]|nr:hypothetical protein [Rudaea sp.]